MGGRWGLQAWALMAEWMTAVLEVVRFRVERLAWLVAVGLHGGATHA
jgi:hypothetical protein